MSPSQILHQIREHYCERLRTAINDYVSDGIITMQSEAVLRRPDGSLATRGNPPMPARVDLITLIDGRVRDGLTIESDSMPSFPPFTLQWEHVMPVNIGPFPWNACDVRFDGNISDWAPLVRWFEAAFDPEETRKPADDGLIGVVHTITPLASNHLQIDFGSAEMAVFEGMIDAMKKSGVESLMIGKVSRLDRHAKPLA